MFYSDIPGIRFAIMTNRKFRALNLSSTKEVRDSTELCYGPITIAIRARLEYDSTTIRLRFGYNTLQHATRFLRALAYEIVYENQW